MSAAASLVAEGIQMRTACGILYCIYCIDSQKCVLIWNMNKFINRIVNYILERRKKRLEHTMNKLKPKTYTTSTTKTHINASETMTLSVETEKILAAMDAEVKNIVKTCLTNPELLLKFVEQQGTPVYKVAYADKILKKIDEEEGFITPMKGFKALYLNFMTGLFAQKKLHLSFKSREMFVLRNGEINIYYMLHQFHKWYGFKKNLPGYDEKAQELFKENLDQMSDTKEMTVEEILALKEAIARDAQAADFVIQLAKESTGAKKALDKMKKDGGAQI